MPKRMFMGLAFLALMGAPWVLYASPFAHPASIHGEVLSAADGQPLAGASVRMVNSPRGTLTNAQGKFQFIDLEAGVYRLAVSYIGFAADTLSVSVGTEAPAGATFRLETAAPELAAVDIISGREAPLSLLQTVDLRLRPVNSSQDFLRLVPGLLIAQHAGGGKAEQIFMRGFDLDHGTDIMISVDGMPVNMVSHAHGQGYADLHFLIPETVERVDVSKGPYQAQDGNLATAGSVRFQTRDRFDGSLVKMELGQYGHRRGVAIMDLNGRNAREGGYVAGEYLLNRGVFESPQDLRRLNLFGKYSLAVSRSSNLEVSASAFRSSWDASGQIPQRAIDSGMITRWGAIDDTEGGTTSRYNLNAALSTELADGSELRQRLYYSRYHFDLYSNFTFFLNDSINGDQIWQTERRDLLGYTGEWDKTYMIGEMEARTRAGWGFRDDAVNDIGLARTLQREVVLEQIDRGNVRETNGFAYIDQTVQLTDRLQANAALRYDAFAFGYNDRLDTLYQPLRQSQDVVSPKLNLRYQATGNVQIYGQAGTGFHSNDTRVVVRREALQTLPRAYGVEAGLLIKPRPRMLINAAVWGLDLDQEFVYVGDEGIVEPSGRTRRVGVDISARYQLTSWLFADADLNFSRPRSRDESPEESFIPLSPTFSSIGGLSVQTPYGLSGSLRYRHLSPRPANEDWTLTAEGYTLIDATVSYAWNKQFTVGMSLTNLLNTAWNEAQFETESRLANESAPVSEIHFTPGSPRLLRTWVSVNF